LALTFSQYVGPIAGAGKFGDKIRAESDYDPIGQFEKEIGHNRNTNPYANMEDSPYGNEAWRNYQ
jgi:hypothetical protein